MIELLNPYYPALLSIPKIHTDLLWLLTMVFCVLGFVYIIFVFFFRNRLSRRAAMVTTKKRELAPIISQFLFFEEGSSLEERKSYLHQKVEIRELIKSEFNRRVLAEILMDLQKDVSGEARQNLYQLYINLGLHHDAYNKLKSWRWEVISQGILELTQMRVEDSYMFIRRFINHSRGVIRKQAQIATVSLKHEGISYFMDTCRYQISEWQQLKLIDVLRHLEEFTPPRFKVWLTSKNKDVVLFALRLIRYYNQNDANPAIIQLIKHRNLQIRSEAIQCLKEFGVTQALDTLKTAFRRSHTDVKLSILDAIGSLGGMEDIDFLKKVERTEENFTVKSKALTAINTIDPDSIMPSEDIREPSRSDREFAEISSEMVSETSQTEIQFEQMENEQEDKKEALNLPEPENETQNEDSIMPEQENKVQSEDLILPDLEEENESIFDICFKEELKDILDEAWEEEEPEYLSLSFMPLLDSEASNVLKNQDPPKGQDYEALQKSDEEKFKQHLDAILNNIAMTNDQNQTKSNEEIPQFLPKVVENTAQDNESCDPMDPIMEIDVIAELVNGKSDQPITDQTQDIFIVDNPHDTLLETEVIAETISIQEFDDDTDHSSLAAVNSEQDSVENEESPVGFSIFHEMLRDFDTESRLILLDEILVVGEEKELRVLEELSCDPDKRIRRKAHKIKELLAEKLRKEQEVSVCEETQCDSTPVESEDEMEVLNASGTENEFTTVQTQRKIPLEYCFYRANGNNDNSEVIEPHFELDLEDEVDQVAQAHSSELDDIAAEKSLLFIKNLFSLTDRAKDKGNG